MHLAYNFTPLALAAWSFTQQTTTTWYSKNTRGPELTKKHWLRDVCLSGEENVPRNNINSQLPLAIVTVQQKWAKGSSKGALKGFPGVLMSGKWVGFKQNARRLL